MKKRKIFWLIIFIAYIMWIFSNSLDIAEASSAKSSIVQQILNQFLFGGNGGLTEHVVRKMAHFSEYALAGVLGEICFQQWDKDRRYERVVRTLLVGILIALCDETIQLFVPGRSGQVIDVWIDFAGYAIGTGLMNILKI